MSLEGSRPWRGGYGPPSGSGGSVSSDSSGGSDGSGGSSGSDVSDGSGGSDGSSVSGVSGASVSPRRRGPVRKKAVGEVRWMLRQG